MKNRVAHDRKQPWNVASAAVLALAAGLFVLAILTSQPASSGADPAVPPPSWSDEPIEPLLEEPRLDPRKVALGRLLFEDPRLSGQGNLSCSSCHDLSTNGAGTGPRTTALDTPSVFNAALSYRLGWEGRERSLEAQALATLEAPMVAQGVPLSAMIERLRHDPALDRRFRAIYGRGADQPAVLDVIATFERSLVTPRSRFDLWLAGDAGALSARERKGYVLFKQLGCTSCHQGRNIGGNMRQRHGIFRPPAATAPAILRVPSLRNVAETAPYFHDGSAATLEIAVKRMAGAQLNIDLTDAELRDISAFLHTLTGTLDGRRVRARR